MNSALLNEKNFSEIFLGVEFSFFSSFISSFDVTSTFVVKNFLISSSLLFDFSLSEISELS